MSLNLHSAVRQIIPAVNADVAGWWYQARGSVIGTDGRQTAAYNNAQTVQIQVQPPSGRDLRFIEYLQMQGVIRTVFMFSDPGTIIRVNQTGNDLLMFPQFSGTPNDVWLVERMDENWNVDYGGWSKLFVVLQTDRMYSALDINGLLALDNFGRIVVSA